MATELANTIPDFCRLLVRSRLFTPASAETVRKRWQAVAREPDRLDGFCAWLVANRHLTAYQADLLRRGKGDNFFLNQYRVLERVGKGRMAGVYKALNGKGHVVALKVLPPSKAKDPELWPRFQRESQMAMQLNHPALVRALDFGNSNDLYYLVMEFLEGITLEDYLKECGPLSPQEAARVGFLATLGLQHIFEKGLVHRDVKPGNLMLCPAPPPLENTLRSMVKILDLGLGRKLFDPESREASMQLTDAGSIVGTPDYLAPEQTRDARKADIRSDLYSLGCTLYHALAGEPPFADNNLVRQILRHATQQPRPLQEFNPQIPDGLCRVVDTMLAKDPTQRYQTPGQAGEALRAFLASAS